MRGRATDQSPAAALSEATIILMFFYMPMDMRRSLALMMLWSERRAIFSHRAALVQQVRHVWMGFSASTAVASPPPAITLPTRYRDLGCLAPSTTSHLRLRQLAA
jgi:hypothetical protein